MTYAEKLKDPRWQKRRLEILERDNFTCVNCSSTEKELHVDHKRYRRGFEPWDYEDSDLGTLCVDCHKRIGILRDKLLDITALMDTEELGCLVIFLAHTKLALGHRWSWWLHWTHFLPNWVRKSPETLIRELDSANDNSILVSKSFRGSEEPAIEQAEP